MPLVLCRRMYGSILYRFYIFHRLYISGLHEKRRPRKPIPPVLPQRRIEGVRSAELGRQGTLLNIV